MRDQPTLDALAVPECASSPEGLRLAWESLLTRDRAALRALGVFDATELAMLSMACREQSRIDGRMYGLCEYLRHCALWALHQIDRGAWDGAGESEDE